MDPWSRASEGGQGWERSGLRKAGVRIRTAGDMGSGLRGGQEGEPL